MDDWLLGFCLAVVIAAITTPAGVSGAVFLLPVQVSVLAVPSPSVTPTNLLYNVLAIPGALVRFAREHVIDAPLTRLLVAGTVPGAVIGAVVRVKALPGADAFLVVIGCVLIPLGTLLVMQRPAVEARDALPISDAQLVALALAVGVVGGIYGIGGGSLLAPILVSMGLSVRVVAPAALASTYVTSLVGVGAYAVLSIGADGDIAPDWILALFLGAGGLIGGYIGASTQGRIAEQGLRRILGVLALALGIRYLVVGLA
jgi:uncharacterized membrane protein YfcA